MSNEQIFDYVERLGNLLRNELRREGANHGLQPVQLEALYYLSICNHYSNTPMGVTEYLGQTKGTVSQSLKVLERNGFISKHPDNNDKRMIHLSVTQAGKEVLAQSIPAPRFAQACEQMNDLSQKRVVKALNELLLEVQLANGMKAFGVCRSCRFNQKGTSGDYLCGLTKEPLSQNDVQLICREFEQIA